MCFIMQVKRGERSLRGMTYLLFVFLCFFFVEHLIGLDLKTCWNSVVAAVVLSQW